MPPETVAVLVTLEDAKIETNGEKLKTLVLFPATFESTVLLVQVTVCGVSRFELHDQFAAFAPLSVTEPTKPPLTVKFAGKVSETVIVPEVGAVPSLVTVNV